MFDLITTGIVAGYAGWNWGILPKAPIGLLGLGVWIVGWNVEFYPFLFWLAGSIPVTIMFLDKPVKELHTEENGEVEDVS